MLHFKGKEKNRQCLTENVSMCIMNTLELKAMVQSYS